MIYYLKKHFSLFNKIENINDESEGRIIDATETKIDRPQKNQEDWYSGKKKQHTIKTQIEIGTKTLFIYSIRFAKGSTHDFKLFKNSKMDYNKENALFVDKGYVGIVHIHNNSIIPIKSSKKYRLTEVEKWYDNEISKIRIKVDMSLICGIYNFEIANL